MLKFIDVIPAQESVRRGQSLNLLGGAANDGGAVSTEVSVWARAEGGWEALLTRREDIGAGEHRHLYYTLGPECFSQARWGSEIEELELIISDHMPPEDARGRVVFVDW